MFFFIYKIQYTIRVVNIPIRVVNTSKLLLKNSIHDSVVSACLEDKKVGLKRKFAWKKVFCWFSNIFANCVSLYLLCIRTHLLLRRFVDVFNRFVSIKLLNQPIFCPITDPFDQKFLIGWIAAVSGNDNELKWEYV